MAAPVGKVDNASNINFIIFQNNFLRFNKE
jgi:hypothetical protein